MYVHVSNCTWVLMLSCLKSRSINGHVPGCPLAAMLRHIRVDLRLFV